MKLEALLVANTAGTDHGLLTIRGGGWEHVRPAMLPTTIRGSLAGLLALSREELGTSPFVSFSVTDDDGMVDPSSGSMIVNAVRAAPPDGVDPRIAFDWPFAIAVRGPTLVRISMSTEAGELGSATFAVLDPVPDTPAG